GTLSCTVMSSCRRNSLAPRRRSQSHTCRCIAGSGTRRRSRRGGKSPAGATRPGALRALLPLLPDPEAVRQHYRDPVAGEPGPQRSLVLVPAQQPLGLLVELLHPVPPVGIAHQRFQRRPRPQVTPVILAIRRRVPARLFADQPTGPALAVGQDAPAAQGTEAPVPATPAPIAPALSAPPPPW